MFEQLGLIGCGLMGGSFALALKRQRLVKRVVGYSKSPSTTERARQLGVIDVAAPSALLAVSGADLVLVAVPVLASEATFRAIRHGLAPHALVMDVGSTKGDVVEAARRALADMFPNFVPAHPIAGKESAGVQHADASLFDGRLVALTPTRTTLRSNVQRASRLWSAMGARVVNMTAAEHDSAFAAISHLPHLLAFAFTETLAGLPDSDRVLALAGPGFRDFTRIAASEPTVWRDVFQANKEQLLLQSQRFRQTLLEFEALVASGDAAALEHRIAAASRTRSQWQAASAGPPG